MKHVLVTGFDPFGGETVNPSFEAVKRLPDEIAGAKIHKRELPTVFGKAGERLTREIETVSPDLILCVGQAGGRNAVTPELVAINYRDASLADNAGRVCHGEPVVAGGPAAYFTRLDTEKIIGALTEAGIPARLSLSAGAFVCNDVMYTLLHHLATRYPMKTAGIIHV
ncbi:MAG: pyroglutamyl-peptidase I, partial [Ruminococcus sp.]|nr:pyroglutamyl-peptidase I [Candidatus Apopatosoma intestinale]